MKRRFTILTAALALLTFLAVPMGMRGQTRTNQTAFYGFETGDAGWTATTFVTNNTAITAHGGSKYGATNGTTASVQYNDIVASPQSLTCYYSKTTTNTNAGSKFHIQVSSNNSTWTTVASGLGMDQVTKDTWYELTADLSSYSNVYVRVRYDGTTGVRALDDITLIYDDGNTPSTDPEITFTPSSITLDEVMVGNEVSTTFSVSQANLTSDITLSVDNGSLSTSSIAQGAAATTVTWTYTPTTAGAISATVTATSGTATSTLAISGTAIAPVEGYDVDFEYATDMYPNWTFDNMTTYQTGSITAHGGTYYGTTGGKATASITTTSTVANPGTLTCYVSKQSGNTTSSTWYIQVSSNGSSWTEVDSHSATSMGQGSWVEFSADLSSYTDVYVRVYYSGSTAIRNIDDLTLTTVTPSPAVATTTTITVPSGFNTDIHNGTSAGTLTATVTVTSDGSAVTGATVTWSSSNTGVATIDANGAVTLVAVGTTTITASYAGVEDQYRPSSATYELTVTDSNAPGTINNPYTVAQALAATPSSDVYVRGIISTITEVSTSYGNATYRISDDGTTSGEMIIYRGKYLNNVNFTSSDQIQVGDEVVVTGTLQLYSGANQLAQNNYIVSLVRPVEPAITVEPLTVNAPAEGSTGTLTATYIEIESELGAQILWYDAEGQRLQDGYDWIDADLDGNWNIEYVIDANAGEARTAYMKVYGVDEELNDVYSELITFNQAAYEAPSNWVLASLADLTPADVFVIVGNNGDTYALPNDASSTPSAVEISVNSATHSLTNNPAANLQWNLILTDDGYIFYPQGVTNKWLNCTNSNNGVRISNTSGNAKHFTLADNGYLTTDETTDQRYIGVFNSQDWRCYTSTTGNISGQTFSFYKKVTDPVNYTMDVEAYEGEGGYYLIASPVASVTPSANNGFLTNDYDLYYFDEAQEKEWINHEAAPFNLVSGKGYLYANSGDDVTLTFTGAPYFGNGMVVLNKTEDAEFEGWNLIGNPFAQSAYLPQGRAFYRLNGERSDVMATASSGAINRMEAVFVIAESDGETIAFSTTAPGKNANLAMNLVKGSNVIDRAIINFEEGQQLPKFMINPDNTKLYISEGNQDFAMVRSAAEGEMPVNFKAENNGTYTLSFTSEEVSFSYLHLVDNMTGADIDLLATPSYSFEARTTDYANRFKLSFKANTGVEENATSTFAYYNGSAWNISNMGEATLQVIDMMGRVLSSETISGNVSISLNQPAGVYMLRLVNGENVMVQKVVVR